MSLGSYYIDPNGGCEKDAIEVYCDYSKELCQSCIDPLKKVRQCLMYLKCSVVTMVIRHNYQQQPGTLMKMGTT